MKTYLMCKPDFFDVNYVINPWMQNHIGKVDKELAAMQWQNLYNALARHAHIKLIAPHPGLPDMVFTANAGLVTKKHEVIVSKFRHQQRQGESSHYLEYFKKQGYAIKEFPPDINFEGAGDALYDSEGRLWVGTGPRSDVSALKEIENALHLKPHKIELRDPRWYHLDTAFCPLADDYVLAYPGALSPSSTRHIQQIFQSKVIWISDEDAMNFACNAICINHEVILNRASQQLKENLHQAQFKVTEINVSEFMKSGGACKCLTLEI